MLCILRVYAIVACSKTRSGFALLMDSLGEVVNIALIIPFPQPLHLRVFLSQFFVLLFVQLKIITSTLASLLFL